MESLVAQSVRRIALHARRMTLRRQLLALGLGLAIIAGLTAADVATPGRALAGTYLLGPLVVSLLAGTLATTLICPVAVGLALASSAWNHNFGTASYWLRATVVLVGSVVAVVGAYSRARVERDGRRFALLVALADVGEERLPLLDTAQKVCALLVPELADLCFIDVLRGEALTRLTVQAHGPDATQRAESLMARRPSTPEVPGSGSAVARGESQLLKVVPDEISRRAAHSDADLELLRSLRQRSLLVAPLRARGRVLGALSLSVTEQSGRSYDEEDLAFLQVLAGRVALALDNAGLFTELESMESRLSTALGSLTEGVTVQEPGGGLVYANDAAARLLGFGSAAEMLAVPTAATFDRFDLFHEDGSALNPAKLPRHQLLAGAEPEPLALRMVDRATGQESWRLTKSSPMRDAAGRLTMVVNVISDITAAKRAAFAQQLLAQTGDVFNAPIELAGTMQQLADLCVPGVADWCVVSLPDDRGQLRAVAVAHSDPRKVELARATAERYPPSPDHPTGEEQVLREGTTLVGADITDEDLVAIAQDAEHLRAMRTLDLRSLLMVPITTGSQTVGVLTLISAESRRRFADEDIALAEELARRAGVAFEHARLYTERSSIARTLQASLLPDELPVIPGWHAATLFRPAGDENSVGGDFYQAVRLADGWLLMVGDVTGRGERAAALTALMRHTLRTAARMSGSVLPALAELNRDLLSRPELSPCTAVCVTVPDAGDQLEIVCAGHPLPVLVRDGQAEEVGTYGPLLGAFPDVSWEPVAMETRAGDVLVLYSDGVLDAVGGPDRFGPDRLKGALTSTSGAPDAIRRLDHAVADFQLGPQSDDIAVLAIERRPTRGARQVAVAANDPYER